MATNKDWFVADKDGLAALQDRRGREYAVLEILSNAWDQKVTEVHVTLQPTGRGCAELTVTDDDPDGFTDLSHAFTLFAHTAKRHNAEVRGRFNQGEKMALSICDWATVTSTTGQVSFDGGGRSINRKRTERGSVFNAMMRLTKEHLRAVERLMLSTIPPTGVLTTFNDTVIPEREPIRTFRATLDTEIADSEGMLRRSPRQTDVSVYALLPGETAMIYELGIPVVETGDTWHVNIHQKVPVNADRDNVTPAYLRKVRAFVANAMHDALTEDEAATNWTTAALSAPEISVEAAKAISDLRFGKDAVRYDPSNQESNRIAASRDMPVISGRSLPKEAWENLTKAGALPPAGRVCPPLEIMTSPNGTPPIAREQWTAGMNAVADYAATIGSLLLDKAISVQFAPKERGALAFYGGSTITFCLSRLGHRFFNEPNMQAIDDLLIHEFAHDGGVGHLSDEYDHTLSRLGSKMVQLARAGKLPTVRID